MPVGIVPSASIPHTMHTHVHCAMDGLTTLLYFTLYFLQLRVTLDVTHDFSYFFPVPFPFLV